VMNSKKLLVDKRWRWDRIGDSGRSCRHKGG